MEKEGCAPSRLRHIPPDPPQCLPLVPKQLCLRRNLTVTVTGGTPRSSGSGSFPVLYRVPSCEDNTTCVSTQR